MPRKPNESGDHYNDPFPMRLRELIKEKGIKQDDLTEVLKVKNRQSITGYIDGSTMPTIEKVVALATFFNVSADFLLGLQESKSPYEGITKYKGLLDLLFAADERARQNNEAFGLLDLISEYCILPPSKTWLAYDDTGRISCIEDPNDFVMGDGVEGPAFVVFQNADPVIHKEIFQRMEPVLQSYRKYIHIIAKEQESENG